jgi:hypothetical protein
MPCYSLGFYFSFEDLHKVNTQLIGIVSPKMMWKVFNSPSFFTFDGLPTPNGYWCLLGIMLGGHGDGNFISFHHTKSLINPFHNVQCFFQCGMTFMIYDELKFCHPLHLLVLFGHVKMHQLSLCANITTFLGYLCQL